VSITERVSREQYAGNVKVDQFARELPTRAGGFRGRIAVTDSRGAGARRSSSGRRGPYACWHVFRDVFFAIFEAHPDAVIRTGLAVYRGRENFLDTYPGTARRNVGSAVAPANMPDLCECAGNVPETARENRERMAANWPLALRGAFGAREDEAGEVAVSVHRHEYDHAADAAWGPALR